MRLITRISTTTFFAAVATAGLAADLRVNIGYGANGSHGEYICELYQNGRLFESKILTNSGFGTGSATFNVPKWADYYAYVYRKTGKQTQYVFTQPKYYWPYTSLLVLNGQFPR